MFFYKEGMCDNISNGASSHDTTEQMIKLLFVFHSSRKAMSPVTDVKIIVKKGCSTELYDLKSWKDLTQRIGSHIHRSFRDQSARYLHHCILSGCLLEIKNTRLGLVLLLLLLVAVGRNMSVNRLSEAGIRAWNGRLCVIYKPTIGNTHLSGRMWSMCISVCLCIHKITKARTYARYVQLQVHTNNANRLCNIRHVLLNAI